MGWNDPCLKCNEPKRDCICSYEPPKMISNIPKLVTYTAAEVEEIARKAYKAGHAECLRDWGQAEGTQQVSYDEYHADYDPELNEDYEAPQLENWIKENLKSK